MSVLFRTATRLAYPGRVIAFVLVAALAVALAGCGLDSIPTAEQTAQAHWSRLVADCRRRSATLDQIFRVAGNRSRVLRALQDDFQSARSEADAVRARTFDLRDTGMFRRKVGIQTRLGLVAQRVTSAIRNNRALRRDPAVAQLMSDLSDIDEDMRASYRDYTRAAKAYNASISSPEGRWWRALFLPGRKPLPLLNNRG